MTRNFRALRIDQMASYQSGFTRDVQFRESRCSVGQLRRRAHTV